MFSINEYHNAGFSMTFENGWTVSVQFGEGNYCLNQKGDPKTKGHNPRNRTCPNAEIAAWDSNDVWYSFGNDDVKGWVSPDDVAKFIGKIKRKKNPD